MRGRKMKTVEVCSYHIEAVYEHGSQAQLDRLLSEAAGRLSNSSGMCVSPGFARDLVWNFGPEEFNLVLTVANRMARVSPKLVSIHVYINYKGDYNSTRLDWNKPDKELEFKHVGGVKT